MNKSFYALFLAIMALLFLIAITGSRHEVLQVHYLYASWCEYCPDATAVLANASSKMGGSINIILYDEAERKTDPYVAQIYSDYKARNLFGGFPTMVSIGKKGTSNLVGLRSEKEVKDWLCSQFVQPPFECIAGR